MDQQEQLAPTTGTTVDGADTNNMDKQTTLNNNNNNNADNATTDLPDSESDDAEQSDNTSMGKIPPAIDSIGEYCLYFIHHTFQHTIN